MKNQGINISNIAAKNSRQSKGIMLMIALASMLICTIFNLGFSLQQATVDSLLETVGDNHVKYENVTKEQVEILSAQDEAELADLHLSMKAWGYPSDDTTEPITMEYSSGLGEVGGFTLASGHIPKAKNEVVIAPHVAEYLGISPKIGEEFTLPVLKIEKWNEESIGTKDNVEFVVSGILREQRMFAAMQVYPMFVSHEFAESYDHEMTLFLRFKGKFDPRDLAYELAKKANVAQEAVQFNEAYLSANLQDFSALIMMGIILFIVCTAGALVIYNAYNLSVEKKIHQYGLLVLLGASKKQIRQCIKLEALCCTVIGLPLGLLIGTATGYASVGVVAQVVDIPVYYIVTPLAYLLSAAVTIFMVIIGVLRPARRTAKIAPVEAVKFTDTPEKEYRRKTLEIVTVNALAKLNLWRKKRRTIGTVVSLTMSGVLFLSLATVAFSIKNSTDHLAAGYVAGDMEINLEWTSYIENSDGKMEALDPLNQEFVDTLKSLDGVEEVHTVAKKEFFVETDGMGHNGAVIGIDEILMQEVISHLYEGEVEIEDLYNSNHAILMMSDHIDEYVEPELLAPYVVGGEVTNDFSESYLTGEDEGKGEFAAFHILGAANIDDIHIAKMEGSLPMLYTLQDNFKDLGWEKRITRIILNIDEEKHDDLYHIIENLCKDDASISFQSHNRLAEELKSIITGLIALLMLMLAVVALIGILNFVGSVFMGIEQRKKEMGVLMAIGLGYKEVSKMLRLEGIWISVICIIVSIPLGLGIGIGLYYLLINAGATYLKFTFPLLPIILLCLIYSVVPRFITFLAVKRLGRFTIVELQGRQT